jgi:hypothetical protein
MDFVTGMQPLEHLESADLSTAIGGMQKAGANPEDLHETSL